MPTVPLLTFAAVVLTAPMALSRSQGSEMRSPMAIAVASGLLFGMMLTLFVIPTVYNYVHIGNWSFNLICDVLVRWLKASGYGVEFVMNITVRRPPANSPGTILRARGQTFSSQPRPSGTAGPPRSDSGWS